MNESQKLKRKKDQQRIYTVFQLGEVQKLAKVKLTYSGKRQNGDQPGDGGWGMPSGRGRMAPPGGTNTQLCIVVQSLSRAQLFVTPHDCSPASLSFTISWSLLKLMSIELMMPSNHLILFHSHLLILLLLSYSAVSDSVTPWTATLPDFLVLHHLLKFAQTHVH